MTARRILVCGAGGFIGGHLVKRLVADGDWVRGVDVVERPYGPSEADEFVVADLRDPAACAEVLAGGFDEVYQLAADMGGMEFISSAEVEIMRNNALININLVNAAAEAQVGRYFYSSSVCIYRDMAEDEAEMDEEGAYPAAPDNEYGWEKLYAERVVDAVGRHYDMATRIARFENCFGPEGAWRGGREKAPAALCRKIAMAKDGDSIDVFGGGDTFRSFVYVEDLVDAVITLTRSDETRPVNVGVAERVKISDFVMMIAEVAGKQITINAVPGPLGVHSRNFSHKRIEALGWEAKHTLRDGLAKTYPWIEQQVHAAAPSA